MRTVLAVLVALAMPFATQPAAHAETLVLTWEQLIPDALTGEPIRLENRPKVLGVPTAEDFKVSKEEMKEFLGEIKFMKDMQPDDPWLVSRLNGKKVRIPGYATPVGFDGDDVTQFLLVPYLGACIHVPPPPANQIVFVKNAKGLKIENMWEPVWLTGVIQTKSISTVLADVGYTIAVGKVEPYDAYPENVKEAH